MQFFESPYVIIALLGVVAVLLAGIGIAFAVRGMNKASGEDQSDFCNISKLENRFVKLGKSREDRVVVYSSISLDEYRNLYSSARTEKLLSEIKVNRNLNTMLFSSL